MAHACVVSSPPPSSETQGQIVGPKTKIKTGGKKFDEQKYERKLRAAGDKLFTHQFQMAERILAPDWAENFSAQSGAIVLILLILNLALTRRIYSTVDVFTVICMQNNAIIIMKKLPPELAIPFRMVHKQQIKLNRLGS